MKNSTAESHFTCIPFIASAPGAAGQQVNLSPYYQNKLHFCSKPEFKDRGGGDGTVLLWPLQPQEFPFLSAKYESTHYSSATLFFMLPDKKMPVMMIYVIFGI